MIIFYFTGTGNSLYVAKRIGGVLIPIKQMEHSSSTCFQDDKIGFVFPTYAVGIPRMVKRFIQTHDFKAEYLFAIMTYGGCIGSSLQNLEEIFRNKNLRLHYANEVRMVDNYGVRNMEKKIACHDWDGEDKIIQKIAVDIQNQRCYIPQKNGFIRIGTKLAHIFEGHCYDDADKGFIVRAEDCVNCKLCEQICPAHNIRVEKGPVFLHKCEGCYACVHSCPQKVIQTVKSGFEKQYRHPKIKVSELVNDQFHN